MSVFDINPGSTGSGVELTGETGSVVHQDLKQEGSANGLYPNTTQPTQAEQVADSNKKIILDGPLSEIYTKALNMVFSNQTEQATDSVSQETQQMDAVMVADIHAMNKEKIDAERIEAEKMAYVYVTSSDDLTPDGIVSAFDDVRIALDSNRFAKTVVCIETLDLSNSTRVELLANMARNLGAKVFYTRNTAMKYLNGIRHE